MAIPDMSADRRSGVNRISSTTPRVVNAARTSAHESRSGVVSPGRPTTELLYTTNLGPAENLREFFNRGAFDVVTGHLLSTATNVRVSDLCVREQLRQLSHPLPLTQAFGRVACR